MSHYEELLSQLHAAQQRRRSTPKFDIADHAEQQRSFRKSLAGFERGLNRLAPKKQTLTPRDRRRQVGQVMAKALAAFREGQITGEQLRALEARHHNMVDAMAQRGAL